MKKHLRMAIRTLENGGVTVNRTEFTRGGHLRIQIQRSDGSTRELIHGASPSDHRAMKNLLAIARRISRLHAAA